MLAHGQAGTADDDGLPEVVAAVLGVDPAVLTDDAGPATIDRWTSLKHLQLVVAVEDRYQVSLSHQEIVSVRSVGDRRAALRQRGVRG
jgi:acyl carrier protein